MKNNFKAVVKDEAKHEGKITTESMMQEIVALLKEFYVATIRTSDNAIIMRFLNGQQVIVTVFA